MNYKKKQVLTSLALILLLTISAMMASAPFANAQTPTRDCTAYLSLNPHLLGLGQAMTVNLWILPSPATLNFGWYDEGFRDVAITFTRPDGSKDTFMPIDGSGGLDPGETEMIGAIWFYYTPNQIGTWSVKFSMPGQTIGLGKEAIYYESAASPTATFTVQSEKVQIGFPPVSLPSGYWERPINSDNRERIV